MSTSLANEKAAALKERALKIPIFEALKLRIDDLGEGSATLTMPYLKSYDGIFESFHGGLLMTLADTAACVAVLTKTAIDDVITTTDMNIRFLAPCTSDATAEATLIKFGRMLCPVEVLLRDQGGKQVAVAQVAYLRLPAMPKR